MPASPFRSSGGSSSSIGIRGNPREDSSVTVATADTITITIDDDEENASRGNAPSQKLRDMTTWYMRWFYAKSVLFVCIDGFTVVMLMSYLDLRDAIGIFTIAMAHIITWPVVFPTVLFYTQYGEYIWVSCLQLLIEIFAFCMVTVFTFVASDPAYNNSTTRLVATVWSSSMLVTCFITSFMKYTKKRI